MSSPLALIVRSDQILKLAEDQITCRASDGFINLTELCKAGRKAFKNWHQNQRSQAFLEALSKVAGIPATEFIHLGTVSSATWGHPQVAINIAQWISPEFDVQVSKWIYELGVTGKVELGKEKSQVELEQEWKAKVELLEEQKRELEDTNGRLIVRASIEAAEKDEERKERLRITKNHNSLVKKRRYHKFEDGRCFYIWSYSHPMVWRNKIGVTDNINTRLATARTSVPDLRLEYLVFLDKNELLESAMKEKFRDSFLEINHEIVNKVNVKDLVKAARAFMDLYEWERKEESDLSIYNPVAPEGKVNVDEIISKMREEQKTAKLAEVKPEAVPLDDPLRCPICSNSFKSKSNTLRHIKTVHKKERDDKVMCDQCGGLFATKYTLKKHIQDVHLKASVVRCKICGHESSNLGNLKIHMESKHGNNKVPCPHCEKPIARANLQTHILRKHKDTLEEMIDPTLTS
jgi:uncharacterized C2H2 Zn-finger protein